MWSFRSITSKDAAAFFPLQVELGQKSRRMM